MRSSDLDIRKNVQVPGRRNFGGPWKSCYLFEVLFFTKKTATICVIVRNSFQVPRKRNLGGPWKSCYLLEVLFFTKKTATKCVIVQKMSKSQVGGIFGGHENLAIGWKCYFSQKRLPQMCDHPKKCPSSRKKKFLVAMKILPSVGSVIFTNKTATNVWSSKKMSKSHEKDIFAWHENFAICLKCYSSQKRLPQNVWAYEKVSKSQQKEIFGGHENLALFC